MLSSQFTDELNLVAHPVGHTERLLHFHNLCCIILCVSKIVK